ncbi:MAG: bifunctional precorrin-2 dehydrogenase/sirohydrochlorin ferrochelatase [Firmicutes bacterium]|nr:bifunctional precorrin-2 dehydrogenase/sirohydrochlorin ferrochelatase [Bacillota bacterium]
MGYYPVALDLEKLAVLVVGGGQLAEEKCQAFIAASPGRLAVWAEEPNESIRQWAQAGALSLLSQPPGGDELAAFHLVVLAHSDPAENARFAQFAKACRALVNVADDGQASDFLAMAQVRRGPLILAVSTSGRSPALARWIRRRLEEQFPPAWGEWTETLGRLRQSWPPEERRARVEQWLAERLKGGGA